MGGRLTVVAAVQMSCNKKYDLYFAVQARLLAYREELVLHRGTRNRRAAMGKWPGAIDAVSTDQGR